MYKLQLIQKFTIGQCTNYNQKNKNKHYEMKKFLTTALLLMAGAFKKGKLYKN